MKKQIAVLMAAVMCVSLAACGGTGSAPAPAQTAPAAEEAAGAPAAEADTSSSGDTQEDVTYTVGICQLVQHDALDAATAGFRDALTEALGDAVTFDEQNAQGDSTVCSTIVTGFVANEYDLIMANATPALQAAVSATADIPILGTSVTDYGAALEMDIDPQNGTGVNVAGSSDGVPGELYADLILELIPDAKNVSILYCSAEANSQVQSDAFVAAMEAAAPDVSCTVHTFSDSNDLQSVAASAAADCDAMYIPTDNQAASNMNIIRNVCEPAKIPVIVGEENMCANGALATVSINYYDIGRVCGEQAVRILRDGEDISAMPIAYASDPVKEYNAEYAEAIGFAVPEDYKAISR